MLKIGFGNVAQPDFAFHETGGVRFGNVAKPYSILPGGWIPLQNTAFGNIAESEMGVKNTSKQSYRTCVRMSVKDYELLKKKSAAAGLSANAWLMAQLETNRPVLHREEETWEAIYFMDEVGREINVIARDFNSGYGTAEQLRHAVHLLGAVYERLYALRKKGYLHAA